MTFEEERLKFSWYEEQLTWHKEKAQSTSLRRVAGWHWSQTIHYRRQICNLPHGLTWLMSMTFKANMARIAANVASHNSLYMRSVSTHAKP